MVIGFAVSAAIAATLGAGALVDAFFIALPVPVLIGQFTLSVTLLALIPHYQRVSAEQSQSEAQQQLASLFTATLLFSLILALILLFFSDSAASFLAPGFGATRHQALALYLRWSAPIIPFIVGCNFLQAVENANNLFLRAAFSRPLMTALALGALALFLLEGRLESYFWGFTLGGALGFLWQFRETRSIGSFTPSLAGLRTVWRAARKSLGLMALARGLSQGSEIALQMIASLAPAGAVAIYAFSFKIAAIPLMLAVSLGLALFPRQSAASVNSNKNEEHRLLLRGLNALSALGALFGAIFFLWANHLVILLYERGSFDTELSEIVAYTVRIFSVALVLIVANNAIANAFWAAGRFKERILHEALAIIILLTLAFALAPEWGAPALALGYGLQFVYLLGIGLWRVSLSGGVLLPALRSILSLVAIAAVLVYAAQALIPTVAEFRSATFYWQSAQLLLGAGAFSVVFIGALALFNLVDCRDHLQRAARFMRR
jgi:putative peptidoglycan lipid II flippase